MTRKEALAELIAKVEAGGFDATGTAPARFNAFMRLAEDVLPLDVRFLQGKAWHAYTGSLDAAKALHENVLPGAWAHVRYAGKYGHATVDVKGEEYDANNADNPARAWLLSILRALHAEEAAE